MKRLSLFLLMSLFLFPLIHADTASDESLKLDTVIQDIERAVASKKKDPATVKALTRALSDENQDVRIRERAAWALGELSIKSSEKTLIEAAAHKSLLIRSAAINSLAKLRSASAIPLFIEIAEKDPILSLRQRSTLALGLLRSEKAIPTLVTLSSDPREEIRGAAALALGAVHSPQHSAVEILMEMKGDSSPYVQERALRALEGIQGAPGQLKTQLSSTDPDIRLFAAVHYAIRGKKTDLALLKPLVTSDADEEVRQQLAVAISAIQKRSASVSKTKKTTKSKKKNSPH